MLQLTMIPRHALYQYNDKIKQDKPEIEDIKTLCKQEEWYVKILIDTQKGKIIKLIFIN